MRWVLAAGTICAVVAAPAGAIEVPSERYRLAAPRPEASLRLPPQDIAALLAEDVRRAKDRRPVRYAAKVRVADVTLAGGTASAGDWLRLADGRWLWRLEVTADGASSLDFGFEDYWLPHGAELFVYDAERRLVRGPFSDRHNKSDRQLWTPLVPGPTAILELTVPAEVRNHVSLRLGQVNHGYRFFADPARYATKAEPCNVDVACPEGDAFRDQIRSAAAITIGSSVELCSGALINNTANNFDPLFLTADHCGISTSTAANLVFYFNYQSPTCRPPGSTESGTPIPISSVTDTVMGSTRLATFGTSDFTLLRLNEAPPDSYNVFFSGWDRSGADPDSAFSIHHPAVEEKRLAIENDPVTGTTTAVFGAPAGTHWEVTQWDIGITEQGSSGSPLYDQDRRIVGQLSGGALFLCPGAEEGSDFYAKLSESWNGGGSSNSRLRDWLDPIGTGAQAIDGIDNCPAPNVDITSSKGVVDAGDSVTYRANASGGQAPYSYEWDVDGDGIVDGTGRNIQARYPTAFIGDVTVDVTDAAGCRSNATFGAVVRAPQIDFSDFGNVTQVCGDNDGVIESGEHIGVEIILVNNGDGASPAGFAAFDIDEIFAPGQAVLAEGALPIPSLAPRATTTVQVILEIGDEFPCGEDLGFRLLGSAFEGGFSVPGQEVLLVAPTGPTCDSTVVCTTPLTPDFLAQQGFWYSAMRPGNGMDIHFAAFPSGIGIYSAWYTAQQNHLPIWYYLQTLNQEQLINDQVRTGVLKFTLNGDIVNVAPTFDEIGSTKFSFIDPSTAVMTWTINGQRGGELLEFFNIDAVPVNETLTDQYFNPGESGWGFGLHRQGNQEFSAIYFYGTDGEPVWTVVSSDGTVLVNQGTADLASFKAHCPGCVWTPARIIPGGTMTRTLNPDGTMVLDSMDVSIQGEVNIDWQRTNLPMIQIVPE